MMQQKMFYPGQATDTASVPVHNKEGLDAD